MADSANAQPVLLPGFGQPLNYAPTSEDGENTLFPNALDKGDLESENVAGPLLTLREIAILGYIDHITDKENWEVKIFDETIQAKWKAEILAANKDVIVGKEDDDEDDEDYVPSDEEDDDDDDDDEEDDEDDDHISPEELKDLVAEVKEHETKAASGGGGDEDDEDYIPSDDEDDDDDDDDEEDDEDYDQDISPEELKDLVAEVKEHETKTAGGDGGDGDGKDHDDDEDGDDDNANNNEDMEVKVPFSEAMADWVIAEVKNKVHAFKNDGFVSVYPGQVVKSDTAVPSTLREALKEAIKVLEDVPEHEKDWHPGSGGKVLDLVHPSLFPLVYGRSRVLRNGVLSLEDCINRCGEGEVVPVPPEAEAGKTENGTLYSRKFQWLPCNVALEDNGAARIKSYINNLHPQKHANLYHLVEQVIAAAIPLWNAALTPLLPANSDVQDHKRITYDGIEYEDGDNEEDDDDDDDDDDDESEPPRKVIQPEPGAFEAPPQPKEFVDLLKDYKEKGLQVIVKLANIELTPEKPTYGGGTWHVEGQLNEHICASAIYYFDSQNITESRLAFRRQGLRDDVDEMDYEQDRHEFLDQVFGCENYGPSVQYLGSATTPEGRLLVWPNVLQHRVGPFELKDKSQRGWRKILALFLVDPHIKVISTANVPAQRKDWWAELVQKDVTQAEGKASLANLPPELQEAIMNEVPDFPLGMEEAKALRVELMAERKVWQKGVDKAFNMHTFSLCEH